MKGATAPQIQKKKAKEKAKLRRHYRSLRRALRVQSQLLHEQALATHFFTSPISWRTGRIAAYLASDGEISPMAIIERLLNQSREVALPVVRSKTEMNFFAVHNQTSFVRGRFDILEPDEQAAFVPSLSLALILVPLVAFDNSGNRMGRGGGYYDRHFHSNPAIRVGLGHEIQATAKLSAESWDLPLDAVITEKGWRSFTPRGKILIPPQHR